MATLRRLRASVSETLAGLRASLREAAPGLLARIATPKTLEKQADAATRAGQILSLLFLGPVIVVSLALIVAFNSLLASVFGAGDWTPGDPQQGMFGWLLTAITLGTVIMAAYTWFQFVRTAGFGWFSYDD